jgi:uncharacterized protein (DUF433 family)
MTETAIGAARRPITESLLEMDEQGRAWIKGANTKVIEVALDWIAYRWDAETMHREHPHLSLAQIHAALSYYFAHQTEMDAEIERSRREAEALLVEIGESPLREKLLRLREQNEHQALH